MQPYSESPGEDGDAMGPGIIGQVPGPKSWSEYETGEPMDEMCNMGRNNVTPPRTDIPVPR